MSKRTGIRPPEPPFQLTYPPIPSGFKMHSSDVDIVSRLTDTQANAVERQRLLREFAELNGWFPSDDLEDYFLADEYANGHILVEHGLENAAVITFLKRGVVLPRLNRAALRDILSLSYNNLVDWHLFPDPHGIAVVSNRNRDASVRYFSIQQYPAGWKADSFDSLTTEPAKPDLSRLDKAIINTVSFWKRELSFLLRKNVTNEHISALMNSILFSRALEDIKAARDRRRSRLMLDFAESTKKPTLQQVVKHAIRQLSPQGFPDVLIELQAHLSAFDELRQEDVCRLIRDFYDNRFAPYPYDFGLISKQALSRIYERYVSVLRDDSPSQSRLFDDWATEVDNRELGSYYTPQYIARFFARYLYDSLPNKTFRKMRTLDPACGSGIFLREVMELQCTTRPESPILQTCEQSIKNLTGIDIDVAAVRSAELSLSLLFLGLTGSLPPALDLRKSEATDYFRNNPNVQGAFDVVLCNPPFRSWDKLPSTLRAQYKEFLGPLAHGRIDAFLAILKLGMDAIKPGGYLLYVLPHSFLLADSAGPLRRALSEQFDICALVDLSAVEVFPGADVYVVLLVVQKRSNSTIQDRTPYIASCRASVGRALSDVLAERESSNSSYEVYASDQAVFQSDKWVLLPKRMARLATTLQAGRKLGDYCAVREGAVSGADSIFILPTNQIAKAEKLVWRPLITDREMLRYTVPPQTAHLLFNPVVDGEKLTEASLKKGFPKTWDHLKKHRLELSRRSQVEKGKIKWWLPHRSPQFVFRPKIVCPHLMLSPRFGLDSLGSLAVTRSPVIYPRDGLKIGSLTSDEVLLIMVAILNSSVTAWQVANDSHLYARGFHLMEPQSLLHIRVPDLSLASQSGIREIVSLVRRRRADGYDEHIEAEIEARTIRLYGLSEADHRALAESLRQ